MRTARAVLAAVSGALLLAGCSASPAPDRTLTVFAAASLREAFDEIGAAFTDAHPEVTVSARYDGSSTLVTQLTEGADADVLATADEPSMAAAGAAQLVEDPRVFATNTLVVAVPRGNPGGVRTLADLPRVLTVLCAPQVPCGAAATRLLRAAAVTVVPASLEQNVSAVLTKVATGEADAGLVYATDVRGEDDVDSFVPAGAVEVVNRYPIAATRSAGPAGRAFVDFVTGRTGQQILAEHGFGAP